MKNIVVIYGGVSTEHDISIITGLLCLNSLDRTKYNVIGVYIDKKGEWRMGKCLDDISFYKNFDEKKTDRVSLVLGQKKLYKIKKSKLKYVFDIDFALLCNHGINGEDGSISGLLQLCDIASSAPSIFGLSASMDKVFFKYIVDSLSIPNLRYREIRYADYIKNRDALAEKIETDLAYPVIIKPASLGSSIGIHIARNREEFINFSNDSFRFDNKLLVEKAVENFTELNIAIMKYKGKILLSDIEKPSFKGDMYTFENKYLDGEKRSNTREFPAKISENIESQVKRYAEMVYDKLDLTGVVRADFLVVDDKVYFNELNCIPGSLAYYLFCKKTSELSEMLDAIISQGISYKKQNDSLERVFASSVLNISVSGSKRLKK